MRSSSVSRRAFLQVSLVAAAGAAFGLAGCTPRGAVEEASDTTAASDPSTSDGDAEQSTQRAESTGGSAKPLVVYFSYTGNVDKMAHWIADETGGDLVRVLAKDAYPDDYDATVDRAKEEQDNGTHPEIVVELDADQLAGYDTVFFGFPVWWYDLPMPCTPSWRTTICPAKRSFPSFRTAAARAVRTACPPSNRLRAARR
jgi:hypothetical protein